MKRSLKKYSLLGAVLLLAWAGFLAYAYMQYTPNTDVIQTEIRADSRRLGQQIHEIFSWFDEKKEVFITGPQDTQIFLPNATTTINGKNLTMAVPLELAKKLENEFASGMNIRFVSNQPKNTNNLPKPEDNAAMMSMAEEGFQDKFTYVEDSGTYHYVRPLFALNSCVTCHINVQEGDLLGAVVVETNPHLYVLSAHYSRANLLLSSLFLASIIIFFLYVFLCRVWRKNAQQEESLHYSQSAVEHMSHEMEVLLGNVSRILHTLQEDGSTTQNAELLLALQAMNSELVNSAMKLSTEGGQSKVECYEEVFHVETLLQQCMQLFYARCEEKNVPLQLYLDASVPSYVLGDALHLRQVLMRILKESVEHTKTGSVQVRVSAVHDMAIHLNTKQLNHMPIHLRIEVEDTGTGYVVNEEQGFLANKERSFSSRPVISLKPMADIAALLQGSVKLAKNKNTGAIFELVAQVKLVSEEPVRSDAKAMVHKLTPALQKMTSSIQNAQHDVQQAQVGIQKTAVSVPAAQGTPPLLQAEHDMQQAELELQRASEGLQQLKSGLQAPQHPQQARQTKASSTSETLSATQGKADAKAAGAQQSAGTSPRAQNAQEDKASKREKESAQPAYVPEPYDPDKPFSILIGDSGIEAFEEYAKNTFDKEKIHAHLVNTADEIFKIVDAPDHDIAVVFLRELQDLDVIYTATRIRYLEQLGSKPVAIVLIAEDIVQADMDVLRFFNVSTVDKFPRDPHMAVKVARMALRTQNNQIFQGGKLLAKTVIDGDVNKLFDVKMAMAGAKKDRSLIRNMCSMWVRFYPEQIKRFRQVLKEGDTHDVLRILRSIKNSAGTVGLPMLWEETNRLEDKLAKNEDVRFEKFFSVYEQSYEFLKKHLDWEEEPTKK